ncbi:histidine phosphatase family protein [Streptomyces olivaceiscleroticus]|uniref:Histidine phosphatase family protein n=1 Tax=Streptomyces olivaceiscleroticus TaxID=68245 RepID=A0ABP3JCQ3_9ACTN
MTSRVVFITPATSPSLRQARFDDGDSIDARGTAEARSAAGSLPPAGRVVLSPGVRCRETAAALGLNDTEAEGAETARELAGLNAGRWRGRTLDEIGAAEPEAVARWLADPTAAPHGGESVQDVCDRVGRWLEATAETDGRTLAVVEPEVVRAAAVHALAMPTAVFWRLDVPPLRATEFSGRAGRWNLRLGRPLV